MGMGLAGMGGLVGGLYGLFGGAGSANNVQLPPQFNAPNMSGAFNNAYGGIGGLSNFAQGVTGNVMGPAGQTFGNLYNNPYSGGFQQGAGTASTMGQNAALGAYGTGGALTNMGFGLGSQLSGMGQSMIPGAQAVLNTAFDPQQQLYQYLQNQNQNQSQAILSGAGLGTSPYGAGVAAQQNQLFNMNWQNQQLGRETQGLGAFGTAMGTAGGLIGQGGQLAGNLANLGTGMQTQAPGQYLQASGMPYGTYQGIGANQNQAIQQYLQNAGGAANLQNMPIQDYLSYAGAGNQANSIANQNAALALQQNQQAWNQQMQMGQLLGGSLYGLGQMGMGGFGPYMGNFNMYNSGAYGANAAGDVPMSEAAQAGMASGLTYNPLTGSIG